jgi:hypothetical protein
MLLKNAPSFFCQSVLQTLEIVPLPPPHSLSKTQPHMVLLITHTEGSRLMRISLVRISLLQFFKTFHKYLPYANFGLFISLVQYFGQKIAKKIAVMK